MGGVPLFPIFAANENPEHIEAKTEEAFPQNLANFQNGRHFSCKITKIYHLRLKMALVHYIKDLTHCKRQCMEITQSFREQQKSRKGWFRDGSVEMGVTFHGDI